MTIIIQNEDSSSLLNWSITTNGDITTPPMFSFCVRIKLKMLSIIHVRHKHIYATIICFTAYLLFKMWNVGHACYYLCFIMSR